jgi:predicted transcriptional regulator
MTTPAARTPASSVAARRIQNMLSLVEQFRSREMVLDEVAEFLGFTRSGAQKYVQTLRDANVIELAGYIDSTNTSLGKAVYRLASDPEKIREFQAAIVQPKKSQGCRSKRKHVQNENALQNVIIDAEAEGRQFHILADDTHYTIRFHRAPVQRDPLVEALFGSAKAPRATPKQ